MRKLTVENNEKDLAITSGSYARIEPRIFHT